MRGPTWIRVVLWLVCLTTPGVAALQFTPLAVPIALPENLRGKAIWALGRLPDGRLAAGFEGGVAMGVPGGDWTIVATPNGSPVQTVVAAHGRILVAGGSCAGFVEGNIFVPLAGLEAQITEVRAVPEGWLLSGPAGLWLAPANGTARKIDTGAKGAPVFGSWNSDTVVICAGQPPRRWLGGALAPLATEIAPAAAQARLLRDGLWFTDDGIFDATTTPILPAPAADRLLNEAGLIGVSAGAPWIVCATYWQGLVGFRRGEATPDWTWSGLGACYTFARDGESLLAGTSSGAFGLADPNRVRVATFDDTEILHLEAEPGAARLVTLRGLIDAGAPAAASSSDQLWPEVDGAAVAGNTLHFQGRSIVLPTRYVNGLDVCSDAVAVGYGNTLLVSGAAAPAVNALGSGVTSVASDGRRFLVGTHADGVQTFNTDGKPGERIGTGRSKVRAIAADRVLLLFWSGDIRDSHNNLLGHVAAGNPRDAAYLDVRRADGTIETDRLAILTTRADGRPVISRFDNGIWTPLEVPGLAEIDAETMAVGGGRLYVAGRRGVLEVSMPLVPSSRPVPTWTWLNGGTETVVQLPDEKSDRALLVPGRWEIPPSPTTTYRVLLPSGTWSDARPGVPLSVPVAWGENPIVVRVERNGLQAQRDLVVIRPYPWMLRPWVLVLEALALAAAAWGLSRWRTRHLLRQKRTLETAVELRTAQLRKANAAKEEFLASVSHEIRNPLNGVVGICAILHDSEIGPREKNFVRVLSGCAEQLNSMLDDVLDFSRIDRGEITLVSVPFEICALVEEAVRVMDPSLEACTLQLPETPQWLEGDPGKIRQIVCNLVSNALKYGRPREAGIELRLTPEADMRIRIRLAVHNTGPTIPANELPRLFESFRRGAGTDGTPGFGLGLAVCRRLAERMGGHMSAASAGGDTEFALELPLPMSAAPVGRDHSPTSVSRALAIEDEDYNRLALGHALRALGYEIDWATDGASALQLARRQAYDLILTDWKLPDIDGDELCRQLLTVLAPPRPPIVAVTAYSSAEKMAAARAAGMAGFVTKPITREKLEQLIRNLDTGPQPGPSLDLPRQPSAHPALALLGDLAPTLQKLAADLASGWQQTEAQARLRDPRTSRAAHGLRSLLLLAGESDFAEQLGLLETAATNADWETVDRLLPFLAEEIGAVRARLTSAK